MNKETISKSLELSNFEFFRMHLNIVLCFLPKLHLSKGEISVLAAFMSMKEEFENKLFVGEPRSNVRKMLNLTNPNVSNYIKTLEEKGCIVTQKRIKIIHPTLFPKANDQFYMFKLANNGE